jgi:hypothetical protein
LPTVPEAKKQSFAHLWSALGMRGRAAKSACFSLKLQNKQDRQKPYSWPENQYPVNSIFRKLTKVIWPASIGFAPKHGGFEIETRAR